MKIAFSVATPEVNTPLLPAQQGPFCDNLDVLVNCGYDGVELSIRDPDQLDLKMIEQETQRRNLEIASIHTAAIGFQDKLWLCHPQPQIRKKAMGRLIGALNIASKFSVDVLVGSFRGKLNEGEDREESIRWMHNAFAEAANYAEEKKIRVLFEPQAKFSVNFGFTAQDGTAFAKRINSPGMGIMLDTFHMNVEDASFAQSIFDSRKYLHYLQISDSNRKYPGGGHIPFGEIIGALKGIKYKGYLSLQINREPDYEVAAKLGIDHLRSLL
ncbi:MAG: sugar phosphate isomerase/epimerase family protein [Pseudomonadota bacterium]|nr:sugar phosphate isomerase/epimerase family protein [Pseudomonadota bacterium]